MTADELFLVALFYVALDIFKWISLIYCIAAVGARCRAISREYKYLNIVEFAVTDSSFRDGVSVINFARIPFKS